MANGRRRGRRRGVVLLLVLGLVSVLFIVGMAAITSASRDTQSGKNFAAWSVALQGAQSGIEVARRRLAHPWDINLDHGQDWPGTGGFDAMPEATDDLGSLMDCYYRVDITSTETEHTVLATGRAVVPGGNVNADADVMATRTVRAVFERPKIEIPYAILADGNLILYSNVEVHGDIHCNGNVTIQFGAYVDGNIYAVGTIQVFGTVTGSRVTGCEMVPIPKIVYYGYRPGYDYDGLNNDAVELAGTVLSSDPPLGMPNNPNNVFYSNQSNFTLTDHVDFNCGTMIAKYDLSIVGTVKIKATAGFPALIINDDIQLDNNAKLETEGLVKLRDDVKPLVGVTTNGKWDHKGPVILESCASIASSVNGVVKIEYRADRVSYQPVGGIVQPLPMLSYTEDP